MRPITPLLLTLFLSLAVPSAPAVAATLDEGLQALRRGDTATALEHLRPLARQGDAQAQFRLGQLYARGQGVIQDYVAAHQWLNLAAARGHDEARALRDDIAQRMTADQLAEAQQLARDWSPETAPPPSGGWEPEPPVSVKSVQSALNRLGYDAGPEDGIMGSRTRSAIVAFQRDRNMAVDGDVSRDLMDALDQALAGSDRRRPSRDDDDGFTGGLSALADRIERRRAADEWVVEDLRELADDTRLSSGEGQRRLQDIIQLVERRQGAESWVVDELEALTDTRSSDRDRDRDRERDRERVVQDRFEDGNYSRNPSWTVVSGRFQVQPRYGLRSTVPVSGRPQAGNDEVKPEDLALSILGSVLEQATGDGQGNAPASDSVAEIRLERDFANAFALNLAINSRARGGALEFGPYQGRGDRGYRLVYSPGSQRGLELVRLSRGGNSVVQISGAPVNLEDGRGHNLAWTRDRRGYMQIALDGRTVMELRDRDMEGDFDGFTWINRGGDYGLEQILIRGED